MNKSSAELRKRHISLACLALCFGLGVILLRPSPPPRVLVLHGPFSMPVLMRDRLVQWIPAAMAGRWVWSITDRVFGRRAPVNINAQIVTLPNARRTATLAGLPQGALASSSLEGLQLWFLGTNELALIKQRLEQAPGASVLGRPRISTADGIGAALFVGETLSVNGCTNEVGLKLSCFARVHNRSTDLFTALAFSEVVTNQAVSLGVRASGPFLSVRTNLDLVTRIQVPKGKGVLLLDAAPAHDEGKSFAVTIGPL
jgi:hypothetical protein